MVRSFHYAARVALPDESDGSRGASGSSRRWSLFWRHWVSAAFLQACFSTVSTGLLPADQEDLRVLLDVSLLERTLYELGHELTHRPEWAHIPLGDLRDLLDAS